MSKRPPLRRMKKQEHWWLIVEKDTGNPVGPHLYSVRWAARFAKQHPEFQAHHGRCKIIKVIHWWHETSDRRLDNRRERVSWWFVVHKETGRPRLSTRAYTSLKAASDAHLKQGLDAARPFEVIKVAMERNSNG